MSRTNKESLEERLVKDAKIFPQKKKKKSVDIVTKDTKTSLKIKNRGLLSIEKKYKMF